MNSLGAKDFTRFGRDVQDLIVAQLQAIELDKIGPKSTGAVGKSLIRIIEQSHHFQEDVEDVDSRDNWIAIREMSLVILEEILNRFQTLSDQSEIAEWDRAAVISLLSDISKVCHNEQKRTQAKLSESLGKELSDELLNEILNS